LDQPWPFFGKTFDLTLDLGLLCHLNNFRLYDHLKAVCACSNYLILETAVLDSNDPEACIVKPDNKNNYEDSFNGFSSQMSAANIERLLTQYGMNFQRLDQTKFNSPPYSYDWHSKNDNSFDINKRRIWFCIKNSAQHQNTNPPTNVLPAIHGGTFSSHLTDSKIPISHQKMMTTASAAPPNVHTPPLPPVAVFAATLAHQPVPRVPHIAITSPPPIKIRLFYNYYEDSHWHRKNEIDMCLRNNIDNPLLDVIIVESETNPTFDFMFDKVNKLTGPNDINIICNTDIFFDDTIALVSRMQDKEAYALGRWDWTTIKISNLVDNNSIQNAWIIKGKVENVMGNFSMGKPGSDGRIAYELQKAGYKVSNPSKSIKAHHVHNSNIRHYTENDRIQGEYLSVPIMSL
jgi:hypothetical protein